MMTIWLLMITVTFPVITPSAQGIWQMREPMTIRYIASIHESERACNAEAGREELLHGGQIDVSSISCRSQRIGDIPDSSIWGGIQKFFEGD